MSTRLGLQLPSVTCGEHTALLATPTQDSPSTEGGREHLVLSWWPRGGGSGAATWLGTVALATSLGPSFALTLKDPVHLTSLRSYLTTPNAYPGSPCSVFALLAFNQVPLGPG